MADQNINYKVFVDTESGTASIRELNGQIVKGAIPVRELSKEFDNLTVSIKQSNNSVEGTIIAHSNSEKAISNEINKLNQLKSALDTSSAEYAELSNRVSLLNQKLASVKSAGATDMTKAMNQMKTATGASTSAVLELGRVVQDAPYGIRGMANNITQLVSQVSFATIAAGGFTAALRQMWTALMGPLGIVLAISTVVSALDYFYGGNKKAEDSMDDAANAADNYAQSLEDLYKKIYQLNAIQDVISVSGESISLDWLDSYVAGLDKLNASDLLKILERDIKGITDAFDKLPKSSQNLDGISYLVDKKKELLEGELKEKELKEKILKLEKEYLVYRELSNSEKGKQLKQDIVDSQKELLSLQNSIIKIEEIFKKTEKTEKTKAKEPIKISPFKSKEELDLDVKNQENALLDFEKKIKLQSLRNSELEELASAKTEKEKTEIQRRYAELRLEIELSNEEKKLILAKSNERTVAKIKHDEHVAQLNRAYEEFKLRTELNEKLSASQKKSLIGDAKSKKDISIAQAGGELIQTNKEIDDAYAPLFETFKKLADLRRAALGIVPEDEKSKEFDALSKYIEAYKILMSGVTDFISGEFERQLTIEQNKTNALNEELNNRLLNENLSKQERANIQNEIARNDEALRKKQEQIAKKKFETEKAFNIASAVVDTYAGATRALNDKTVPSTIARFALAGATIASGLLQVAAIARQKFQSSSASTPIRTSGGGGSGGGMADRSFNFNLVGNNRENQLANAIQGQFNQPIKAYVVSRDMSNQQQLDANIVNSARF